MEYLLGIDIGTSACKTAIFDRSGNVIADDSESYGVYYPQNGWAEQDPDEWWGAVAESILACMEKAGCSGKDIAGIGVSGQSWSATAVDNNGKVLCNTPIWMDTRSDDICKKTTDGLGEDSIFSLSGNILSPTYTTGKILWYKEKFPELYGNTYKILQSNSYITYKLTGVFSQDKSQGYGYHCYDIRNNRWNGDMCRKLGIDERILPEIYDCHSIVGYVTKEAAVACGLCEGIPVVAGGLDAACATLGAGVINDGETQEQGGQSGGMSICTEKFSADKRLIVCSHVVPGKWLLQGGTTGGGGVMRWLVREFGAYETEHEKDFGMSVMKYFDKLASDVKPGSDGVVFLPYMAGERTPIWDADAKGVYYGLDFSKTKGHMIRSALEGVAYSLKHNLDVAEAAGAKVTEMRATGGCANSVLWTQIKADITGKRITVPSSDNAGNLGAAILAGVGIGLYRDFAEAVKNTVVVRKEYTPVYHEEYDRGYGMYLDLYKNLKEMMNKYRR